jgi:hypothetical protein
MALPSKSPALNWITAPGIEAKPKSPKAMFSGLPADGDDEFRGVPAGVQMVLTSGNA